MIDPTQPYQSTFASNLRPVLRAVGDSEGDAPQIRRSRDVRGEKAGLARRAQSQGTDAGPILRRVDDPVVPAHPMLKAAFFQGLVDELSYIQ